MIRATWIVVLSVLTVGCNDGGAALFDAGTFADAGVSDSGEPAAEDAGSASDAGPFFPEDAGPPPDCRGAIGGGDGEVDGASVRIGERNDEGFRDYEEGEVVPYSWGFQGGTMVMPILRVEDTTFDDDTVCVHIELVNEFTDEGAPVDTPLYRRDMELHAIEGGYETDPLEDMLSYDSPEGRALSIAARISVAGYLATGNIAIVVGEEL
jgi:hypothetical protein